MAVGKQSLVEIDDKTLAGRIRDGSYAKQGDAVRGRGLGDPAGFHFHGGSPARPQETLFGGGLRHMIDGCQHAGRVPGGRLGQARIEPAARGIHCRGHENIADFQRRIQRSTESHTHDRFRLAHRTGYLNGLARMRRARAVRHHPKLPVAAFSGPRPIERPRLLPHAGTKRQQPVELAGFGGD